MKKNYENNGMKICFKRIKTLHTNLNLNSNFNFIDFGIKLAKKIFRKD